MLAPGTAAGTPRAWKDREEESLPTTQQGPLNRTGTCAALRGKKGDSEVIYWAEGSASNSRLQIAMVQLKTCCASHLCCASSLGAAALLEKPQTPIAKPFHWIVEALEQGKCCSHLCCSIDLQPLGDIILAFSSKSRWIQTLTDTRKWVILSPKKIWKQNTIQFFLPQGPWE